MGLATPWDDRTDAGMSEKYRPLQQYLEHADRQHAVTMTFAQIESILGDALPASAKRYYSFWSKTPPDTFMRWRGWMRDGKYDLWIWRRGWSCLCRWSESCVVQHHVASRTLTSLDHRRSRRGSRKDSDS
jgi:hypothetical protein